MPTYSKNREVEASSHLIEHSLSGIAKKIPISENMLESNL